MAGGSYDAEKWVRQQQREAEREQRADAAAHRSAEREAKQAAVADGKDEAARRTAQVADLVGRLSTILTEGLGRSSRIDLASLRHNDGVPPLDLGAAARPAAPPSWEDFVPREPGALSAMFGGRGRYEARLEMARTWFEKSRADYDREENARQHWVRDQRQRHGRRAAERARVVAEHNDGVEALRAGVASRDRASVEAYLRLVLERVPLPDEVPHHGEVAYSPRGEQAVVRFELPSPDVIPAVSAYTYVGTTGETKEKKRPAAEVKKLYRSVVSQIALLYMRDLFEADPALENLELAGHVHAVNPATGHRDFPCLISVGVDRDRYAALHLRDVTPEACLTHLNALVSRHPHAVEPVTPVRDFDLARYSFVEGVDVVSGLDARTDLTLMSPVEFEHFVRQLFEARGLEGWTTDRSGDDGVDAVVVNPDELVGGLAIVQAKKYTRVVGVSHVRELVGAMDEKRAGRGILVTTSWFASGCWTKATENGKVELIDGPRLRWLVQQHLGRDVLVAPPVGRATTWQPKTG